MVLHGYIPATHVNLSTTEKDLSAALARFKELYPEAHLESIDDREVSGMCESCGLPIFEGEEYFRDTDDVEWHKRCDA